MHDTWSISPHAIATLPVPMWECLFAKNDCSLKEITFWIWILRCGDKIALIDTGLPSGPDLDALNLANQSVDGGCIFSQKRSLTDVLAEERISPHDISFVLLTQLVTYSTGGLHPSAFPNATVYCAWKGMEELLTESPGHPPKPFYFTRDSWTALYDLLTDRRLVFAREETTVAPGLSYDPTGGHHPGSAGVKIRTAKGLVGIIETAFIQENITEIRPIGIAENAALCRQVIRAYRNQCDLVLAGHEPEAHLLLRSFLDR